MTSTAYFSISGMSCNSCVQKVQNKIAGEEGIKSAIVTLHPPKAEIRYEPSTDLDQLNNTLSGMGYLLSPLATTISSESVDKTEETESTESTESFKPLLIVLAYLLLATLITQYHNGWNWSHAMRIFMGGFFLVFSFFKMLDLKGFAQSYSMYDIIAERWKAWGLIYPFIELGLGVAYLINYNPFITNTVTLIVMGISSIGVIKAVLNKRKIKCACLGTGFNLPMTTVTIIEDLTMVAMAAFMLFA